MAWSNDAALLMTSRSRHVAIHHSGKHLWTVDLGHVRISLGKILIRTVCEPACTEVSNQLAKLKVKLVEQYIPFYQMAHIHTFDKRSAQTTRVTQ